MIYSWGNFPGEKVFEDFREIDVFRPRQFSRLKKSFIFSGILMICGLEILPREICFLNNYGIMTFYSYEKIEIEKVSKKLRDIDDLRLGQLGR